MRDIMINNASKPLDQLELIDTQQRLGLAYHFNTEIKNTLPNVYNDSTTDDMGKKGNLHDTSLEIRLLRQHGYYVPEGGFKSRLCDDVKVMLSLYEALYYGLEGEKIMEETWKFTTRHLNNRDRDLDLILEMQVSMPWKFPCIGGRRDYWRPVIDDVYDVYGTLNELELFTDAVDRWDLKAMKQLPDYMKICFLALYNSVDEMASDILKEQDSDVILNLKNSPVTFSRTKF
ncbi:hypothetical protein QYF36_016876 [Acer negundo]|nr:hypothetical protein QYF36_016876 [Acer negundo]